MAAKGKTGTARGDVSKDRAHGRELAFLVLCHLESYGEDERADAVSLFWDNPPGAPRVDGATPGDVPAIEEWLARPRVRAFAQKLVGELLARWSEIDALIESTSRSWRISRMGRVDRNVLRLATLELEAHGKTPRAVVLSEAVRLASSYGSERSGTFVNGIAEALARKLRASP